MLEGVGHKIMGTKIQRVKGRWSGFRHHAPTHLPSNTWQIEGSQEEKGEESAFEGYLTFVFHPT